MTPNNPENSNVSERRREIRFMLSLPAELIFSGNYIKTKTKNISGSGIFCEVGQDIPIGSPVEVKLIFSFHEEEKRKKMEINCSGRIVRSEPLAGGRNLFLTGINFENIETDKKEFLLQYIRQKNLKEAQELKRMYLRLKEMAGRLVEVEECHPTAEHFRKVVDRAITELDAAAHILDFEINELRTLE